jgi:tRNA A-37 threonylcarbamoyl transferase component Bud32
MNSYKIRQIRPDESGIKLNEHGIDPEKLNKALGNMYGTRITHSECQTKQLHGGTVGNVLLITGAAETAAGLAYSFKLVLKTQKKWERYGDPESWRREYDLYASDFGEMFTGSLRWPKCYLAEMSRDKWQIWMEHIDGVTGADLTAELYERAAAELGRFQGKLYAGQPELLANLSNLSEAGDMKSFYLHYRSWKKLYDYVRSGDCGIPAHLCKMIIETDEKADEIWRRIEKLPVVLCHRDFWVTNIFYSGGEIVLIDWDTTGWGHMGEDIVSMIADEADVEHMVEYYEKCVPAYRKGFSEFAVISDTTNLYIRERIIMHFGYRLVEWYLNAESSDYKALQINTLQKIYEMK